jgi:SAM-dependent methyltransferase
MERAINISRILPLRCPCESKSPLKSVIDGYVCDLIECHHSRIENCFRLTSSKPILISDKNCDTVCNPENIYSYVPRSSTKIDWLKNIIVGENKISEENCIKFIRIAKELSTTPKILVIGSGKKGDGTAKLWNDENIEVHGIDIYSSPTVHVVGDAHYLPLAQDFYDGVWIQAVLEHVVAPYKVVSEIHRVLKGNGIVYSETPFMQQVHEGAYDFTRFTVLGHRYLFRKFEMLTIGATKGPEVVLAWSIRYFVWAVTRSRLLGKLFGVVFGLLLRPFCYLTSMGSKYDSPSGVFFMGRKSEKTELSHKDLITLYKGDF